MKEPRVHVVKWLPFGAVGLCLYPDVWVKHGWQHDKCLMAHEMVHFKEQEAEGLLPWLAQYLVLRLWYAGREHPFEARAYAEEAKCRNR